MPKNYSTQSLPPTERLWNFEHRDRAITREILGGTSLYLVSRLYGLTQFRIRQIVRRTCERVRPDWNDEAGYPLAWKAPLRRLRAERETFPL